MQRAQPPRPACLPLASPRETMLEDRKRFFKQLARWMGEATWHSLVTFLLPM
jgi:hypothetical protein